MRQVPVPWARKAASPSRPVSRPRSGFCHRARRSPRAGPISLPPRTARAAAAAASLSPRSVHQGRPVQRGQGRGLEPRAGRPAWRGNARCSEALGRRKPPGSGWRTPPPGALGAHCTPAAARGWDGPHAGQPCGGPSHLTNLPPGEAGFLQGPSQQSGKTTVSVSASLFSRCGAYPLPEETITGKAGSGASSLHTPSSCSPSVCQSGSWFCPHREIQDQVLALPPGNRATQRAKKSCGLATPF